MARRPWTSALNLRWVFGELGGSNCGAEDRDVECTIDQSPIRARQCPRKKGVSTDRRGVIARNGESLSGDLGPATDVSCRSSHTPSAEAEARWEGVPEPRTPERSVPRQASCSAACYVLVSFGVSDPCSGPHVRGRQRSSDSPCPHGDMSTRGCVHRGCDRSGRSCWRDSARTHRGPHWFPTSSERTLSPDLS
jgi:hypothetical protein